MIVIIQVKPRCTLIQFKRFLFHFEFSRQHRMDRRRKARFMNRHRFIKFKVAPFFFRRKSMIKEINALQNIRLLNKTGAENFVP